MVFSFMVSVQNKSMRIPFQTALAFHASQAEDAANRVGANDFKSAHASLCHI